MREPCNKEPETDNHSYNRNCSQGRPYGVKVVSFFLEEIEKSGADDIILTTSSCAGFCSKEPMVTVELKDQPPIKYIDMTAEKVKEVFAEHIMGGKVKTEYALAQGSERVS